MKIHKIYKKYGINDDGEIIHVERQKVRKPQMNKDGYYTFSIIHEGRKKTLTYHKFIYECHYGITETDILSGEGMVIDHIDNNKLNNRIENLQCITTRENTQKYHKDTKTSKYTGVKIHQNKYRSYIKYKGITYHLGCFDDEIDAAKAFDEAYYKIHGLRPNLENDILSKYNV